MADHLVKLIHAKDLKRWERLPVYEEHVGKTLAQYQAEVNARKDFEWQNRRLIEAQRLVDGKDDPKIYRTETIRSPWPISLPGRRSVCLSSPDHPETTFESDIGRVKAGRLVLPLFIKERQIKVHYLAPDRVTSADRISEAKAQLAHTSEIDMEKLRTYFTWPEPNPLLFVSHRWESLTHPDPEGRQLGKLKALKDCYLIYDYTSFPQDTTTPEAKRALRQVLDAMNKLIDNVLVLSDPDYMNRGWCIYEYIAGSLTHRIVCDEINDPALVRLRNLVATKPNPPGLGSTHREAVNAKNQFILEAVNGILPAFSRAGFTVSADRVIVQNLLIQLLRNTLPRKQEYIPYVGEWKTVEWTEQELAAAFESKLEWEALQHDQTIPVFEPTVPNTIGGAVTAGFGIEKQPKDFGQERYNWDLSGVGCTVLMIRVIAGTLLLLLLWGLYRFVLWIFGI